MNTQRTPLWTRPFLVLTACFFLAFSNISFFYLYPLALDAVGISKALIGWVMGIFSLSTVLSRPLMGHLVSKKGERMVIWWGMVLMTAASAAYLWIKGFGFPLLVVRVVHGIGFSAFVSGGFSLVAREISPYRHAEAYGIVGAALMAAVALAPPLGELLIQWRGFSWVFAAAAVTTLIASVVVGALPGSNPNGPDLHGGASIDYMSLLLKRSYIYLLVVTFVFSHTQSTVVNFVALLAKEKGVESGGFFFVSFALAILILLSAGRFIQRRGKLWVLRTSYPSLALGVGLIPLFIGSNLFFLPALFFGCAMGLLFPALNALAADHGTRQEKPATMAIFTAVYDTGFITGGLVSGALSQSAGLGALFGLTGLLAFGGFVFLALFFRHWP